MILGNSRIHTFFFGRRRRNKVPVQGLCTGKDWKTLFGMQRYAVHAKIYLRASPEKNNRDQFLKYSGKKLEIIAVN